MSVHRLLQAILCLAACAAPVLQAQPAQAQDAPPTKRFVTTPMMAEEARLFIQLLEKAHYSRVLVTNNDFRQMLEDYLGELDNNHLFLLRSEVDEIIARRAPDLAGDLRWRGSLDTAFECFNLFRRRVGERVAWLLKTLDGDIDLTTAETYEPDRTKAPWPATAAEADDLWMRRLKFELLADMLDEQNPGEARSSLRKRYERMTGNLDDLDASDIQEIYLSTLARLYDPHSTYFSATTLDDFSISMSLQLVGIGAMLSDEEGRCIVREIVPGGPADISHSLRPKDQIVAVAQDGKEPVDVIGMKLRRIVEMIRGQKGTRVTLTIIPAASPDREHTSITFVRDVVKLNSSRAQAAIYEVPDEDGKVQLLGYIHLPAFYGAVEDSPVPGATATGDVRELIGRLREAGIHGLVLDLRNNGGGLLSEAVDLAGLFIPQGPVVQVRDHAGQIDVRSDADPGVAYQGPLVVLVSRFSASASEIVAGALQNYGRALIVGDSSTHGKGTVQNVFEMQNFLGWARRGKGGMGAAKLTIQKYYLPNGSSTQNKGVIPDITLPSIDDFLPIGESDLPHALAWDEIPGSSFEAAPPDTSTVSLLAQESRARQDRLEEFSLLRRYVDWFRTRQEVKSVSLNLASRRQQKETDKAFEQEMKDAQAALLSQDYKKTDVKLAALENIPDTPEPDAETGTEPSGSGEDGEDGEKTLDVPLRESLRVLCDILKAGKMPPLWTLGDGGTGVAASTLPEAR